jgi:hypothetical protein
VGEREYAARALVQPLQHEPHRGRLVRGRGLPPRGGGLRVRHRLRHRWLDPDAVVFQRRVRPQTVEVRGVEQRPIPRPHHDRTDKFPGDRADMQTRRGSSPPVESHRGKERPRTAPGRARRHQTNPVLLPGLRHGVGRRVAGPPRDQRAVRQDLAAPGKGAQHQDEESGDPAVPQERPHLVRQHEDPARAVLPGAVGQSGGVDQPVRGAGEVVLQEVGPHLHRDRDRVGRQRGVQIRRRQTHLSSRGAGQVEARHGGPARGRRRLPLPDPPDSRPLPQRATRQAVQLQLHGHHQRSGVPRHQHSDGTEQRGAAYRDPGGGQNQERPTVSGRGQGAGEGIRGMGAPLGRGLIDQDTNLPYPTDFLAQLFFYHCNKRVWARTCMCARHTNLCIIILFNVNLVFDV